MAKEITKPARLHIWAKNEADEGYCERCCYKLIDMDAGQLRNCKKREGA